MARFRFGDRLDLGREMFRWEIATAAAGAVLGVNPFDQPDVQLAKELANQAMKDRGLGERIGRGRRPGVGFRLPGQRPAALARGRGAGSGLCRPPRLPAGGAGRRRRSCARIQAQLRDRTRLAVTLGYGPRFLHSTGQLHKGGPATGRFLQLVDEPAHDLPVPETDYTFGTLIRAQADGDRAALEQRGGRCCA